MTNQNSKLSETEAQAHGQKPEISKLAIWVTAFCLVVFLTWWLLKSTHRETLTLNYRIPCSTNLRGLGIAMLIYASDYDGQYPTAEKWCDLLVMHCDVSPKQLVCKGSDAKIGESSYAFNKNLIDKKSTEVPPDVVVLFETNFGKNPAGRQALLAERDWHKFLDYPDSEEKVYKLRWNQFGGPEILTTENHEGKGCNILFNDSRVEFVKTERLGELKWEVEESEE